MPTKEEKKERIAFLLEQLPAMLVKSTSLRAISKVVFKGGKKNREFVAAMKELGTLDRGIALNIAVSVSEVELPHKMSRKKAKKLKRLLAAASVPQSNVFVN